MIRFNRAITPVKVLSFDLDDTLYNNLPTPQIALSSKLFTRAQLLLYNDERINHLYHASRCFPAIKILPRSRADVHGDEL